MKLRDFASNLYLHESLHLISGVIISWGTFLFYGKINLALVAFAASFIIDADHYFEALFYFRLNPITILKNRHNCWMQTGKMTILFHSWECIFVCLFINTF